MTTVTLRCQNCWQIDSGKVAYTIFYMLYGNTITIMVLLCILQSSFLVILPTGKNWTFVMLNGLRSTLDILSAKRTLRSKRQFLV
jgi:hypothetical protein